MKQVHAEQSPKFTTDVPDGEKAIAKQVKKDFKDLLDSLDDALKLIYDFKDAVLEEHPSKEDLNNSYKGRVIRYKRKLVEAFNGVLEGLKKTVNSLQGIMDPEMLNLRALIMAEFDELSDGVEGVLDLFKDMNSDGFTKELERLCTQLKSRKTSISGIIDNQLMSHLENDILGKMKISSMQARIIKRTRLMRKRNINV